VAANTVGGAISISNMQTGPLGRSVPILETGRGNATVFTIPTSVLLDTPATSQQGNVQLEITAKVPTRRRPNAHHTASRRQIPTSATQQPTNVTSVHKTNKVVRTKRQLAAIAKNLQSRRILSSATKLLSSA